MQPVEQAAPIQLQCLLGPPSFERRLKLADVAAQALLAYPQLLLSSSQQRSVTECLPQRVDGLAEGIACMRVVELGPQQRDEGIAALEAPGARNGEIAEESKQLGAPEDCTELATLGVPEIHRPQQLEPDHDASPARCAPLAAV